MIFTKDQTALILAGKQTATLIPLADTVKLGATRILRQRTMRHDEDGNELGWRNVPVLAPADPETGDRVSRVITITEAVVSDVDPPETDTNTYRLTDTDIENCGHRTLQSLKDWWLEQSPGLTVCRLVKFNNGDTRDLPRLLARVGGYTSVTALTVDHEAEAVTFHEQHEITITARSAEAERLADPDLRLYRSLLHDLEQWETETGGRASNREAFMAIRAIRDQLRSLDRRLKVA